MQRRPSGPVNERKETRVGVMQRRLIDRYAGGAVGVLLYAMGARPNFVKMAPVIAELRKRCLTVATYSFTPASTTTG